MSKRLVKKIPTNSLQYERIRGFVFATSSQGLFQSVCKHVKDSRKGRYGKLVNEKNSRVIPFFLMGQIILGIVT